MNVQSNPSGRTRPGSKPRWPVERRSVHARDQPSRRAILPCVTAPTSRPFVISKETTFFSGPLRKDGTIDYVAAINQEFSSGVTKQNNAAIPLLEVINQIDPALPGHYAKLRKELGVADPAPQADRNAGRMNGNELDPTLEGPWTARRFPEISRWLDSMKPILDQAVEASKREHYYLPLVREKEEDSLVMILLPHLNTMRYLSNILKSRAMFCLGNEDMDGFSRDVMAIVRIGRLNTHAPTIIEHLVGEGIEANGLSAIRCAATDNRLSERDALRR